MGISINFETENNLGFPIEPLISEVITAALSQEGCPFACSLEVLLTDNDAIREINAAERGIDSPTDVLSFPAVSFLHPSCFENLSSPDAFFDPESGELILGDIVISLDKVMSQAKEYGHSERRELAFLTAHSVLHLLGYDHEEDAERIIMEEKQEQILQSLGIKR